MPDVELALYTYTNKNIRQQSPALTIMKCTSGRYREASAFTPVVSNFFVPYSNWFQTVLYRISTDEPLASWLRHVVF